VHMTRVAVIDPQPAMRAGLAWLLRGEPGMVWVADPADADVALLDHSLAAEGLALCRRLDAAVVLYTTDPDPALPVLARVAGAHGVVDKTASPEVLFETIRRVGRGEHSLPPITAAALEEAAERVGPDDLAIVAMLADGSEPEDLAAVLRLDGRGATRRVERVLARLAA
jgi:DNA-binding NarL/FixJ family response regulator